MIFETFILMFILMIYLRSHQECKNIISLTKYYDAHRKVINVICMMISQCKATSILFWPACSSHMRVSGGEKYISSTRPSSCRILRCVGQIHIYFERKSAKSGRCRSYVMSRYARACAYVQCRNIPIRVQRRVILWGEGTLVRRQAEISNSW